MHNNLCLFKIPQTLYPIVLNHTIMCCIIILSFNYNSVEKQFYADFQNAILIYFLILLLKMFVCLQFFNY